MGKVKKERIINPQKMILIDAYGRKQEYIYNAKNNTFEVGGNVEIDGNLKINGKVKEIKCVNSSGNVTTQISNGGITTYDSDGRNNVMLKSGKLTNANGKTITDGYEMYLPSNVGRSVVHIENDNITFHYDALEKAYYGLSIENLDNEVCKLLLRDNNKVTTSFRMYGNPNEAQGYFNFAINDDMTLLKILNYDSTKKVLTIECCEAKGVIKIDALNNSITFNGKELVNPTN